MSEKPRTAEDCAKDMDTCPFCGCAMGIILWARGGYEPYGNHEAGCVLEGAQLSWYGDPESLVDDWNRRDGEQDLPPPHPIEAIKFRMEHMNLTQRDLIPYIGNASKVSEVLSGKIGLSKTMMRRLHKGLNIPAHILLNEPVAGGEA
ncbi:MAG: hypothetical protein AB7E55_32015 [Pigmentiphaga sp.]